MHKSKLHNSLGKDIVDRGWTTTEAMEPCVAKKLWKRIKSNFFFSPYIHCHPYVWNKETKLVAAIPKKSWGFLHWYLNITLYFLHYIFVQFRSLQVYLDPRSSAIKCVLTQLMAAYYATCGWVVPAYVFQREDVPGFVNSQMKFLRFVHTTYNINPKEAKQLYGTLGMILQIFQACSWIDPGFLVLIAIVRPWSPELVSSLMPGATELAWGWRLLFGSGQLYLVVTMVEGTLMLLSFMILLVHTTSVLLCILRVRLQDESGCGLRQTLRKTLHSHRCLQLQLRSLRITVGKPGTYLHVLVLTTAIVCSYEAVRLTGIQSLALGVIAGNWTAMLLIWINLLANVNYESLQFLRAARKHVSGMRCGYERKALEKELKGTRELRVYMVSSSYYDKLHMLTTIGFITNYMATMTLTL